MPSGQHYATNVPQAQLTVGINNSVVSFAVNSLSGWPAPPFTAALDLGQSNQEVIDVTAISGSNITSCTRAIDGTTAFSHSIGATFTHVDIGRDFREARAHMDASSSPDSTGLSVHGLGASSAVVGTTDSQTLTNKSLTSPSFTGTVTMGSGAWSGSGSLVEGSTGVTGKSGAQVSTVTLAGSVAGAAPTSGTFSAGDMVVDTTYHMYWLCTAGGTPGTWAPMGVGTTGQITAGSVNVPAWANSMRLTWNARSNDASTGGTFLDVQFNGDTGNNYTWQDLTGNTTTAAAGNSVGVTNRIRAGIAPKANDTANYFGTGSMTIHRLQNNSFKTMASYFNAPLTNATGWTGTGGGTWLSTAAVTSVALILEVGSFVAGSTMSAEFFA